MAKATLVEEGVCECILEPLGDHGLEGYDIGEKYNYKKMKDDKGHYMRVYHSDTYYETCGPRVFEKYFKVENVN